MQWAAFPGLLARYWSYPFGACCSNTLPSVPTSAAGFTYNNQQPAFNNDAVTPYSVTFLALVGGVRGAC